MEQETSSRQRSTLNKVLLSVLSIVLLATAIAAFRLTRDGELVTPVGESTVAVESGTFEHLPLPDYALSVVDDEYESYLVEVEPGIKIHILEVGSGYPVYLQHGAPTSGLLYRKVAELLPRDQFRIIMPTMVGLGFSSKVPASQHTLDNHIRWMEQALDQLELDELIFVGHDWGGPVGMGTLERSPDVLEGAVILNTVLDAPTAEDSLPFILRFVKTPVVAEIVLEGVVSIFDQLPDSQNDPDSMPADVIDLYARPVNESGNGKGPLAILRMTADGVDHPTAERARTTETYIRSLDIPAEIVWGMNDPRLGERLDDMVELFPNARVTETDAGHFLQEEVGVPEEIAAAVMRVHEEILAGSE